MTRVLREYPATVVDMQPVVIRLEVTVGTSGDVVDVRPLTVRPPFDAAAVAAVKQWRFETTVVGGVPVPATFTLAVPFSPQ
ncbi:MAG: TonB family protein [Vicinamibacterales bacterium]